MLALVGLGNFLETLLTWRGYVFQHRIREENAINKFPLFRLARSSEHAFPIFQSRRRFCIKPYPMG